MKCTPDILVTSERKPDVVDYFLLLFGQGLKLPGQEREENGVGLRIFALLLYQDAAAFLGEELTGIKR